MGTLLGVSRGGVLERNIFVRLLDRLHRCTEHNLGN
jgi:hypothetical protein